MKDFHFFASSVAEWISTRDTRELPDLIAWMDKAGFPYSVWLVPGRWTAYYEIKHYAPQVEGAQLLGTFDPPGDRKKKHREIEKNTNKKLDAQLWAEV